MFGGSGLVSRIIKDALPDKIVVYSDFDNYIGRCKNVSTTNQVIQYLQKYRDRYEKKEAMTENDKQEIIDYLKTFDPKKVDIKSISTNILYSLNYAEDIKDLENFPFYNMIKPKKYNENHVINFHKNLEVQSLTWSDTINKYNNSDLKVFYLADPPYMDTDCNSYEEMGYWAYDVFFVLNKQLMHSKHDYCFFTSDNSNLVEIDKFLKLNYNSGIFSDYDKLRTTVINPRAGVQSEDQLIICQK